MRILLKLAMKFVTMAVMVVLMAGGLRYGRKYIAQAMGMPGAETTQFSSDESDLMTTVFKSALKLFSGSASRNELSSELSDKLYAGRDQAAMSELGIELVKPGETPDPHGASVGGAPKSLPGFLPANSKSSGPNTAKAPNAGSSKPSAGPLQLGKNGLPLDKPILDNRQEAMLTRIWGQTKKYSVEIVMIPVVFFGMVAVNRVRRRRNPDDGMILPDLTSLMPKDTEAYEMKHAVHRLNSEDFEMLVAVIYQRQGYRVSMPEAQSGGRGGDFILMRKAEKLLVQCKKLPQEHRVPVERVRELFEAGAIAGATRAVYVASCGFSWDAKNFAKAKGMTLINAQTLDALISVAREKPDEDMLAVDNWAPKLMRRVILTPPSCPACEASMEKIVQSNGSVWVCSQRPDCKGRRASRRHQKPPPAPMPKIDPETNELVA